MNIYLTDICSQCCPESLTLSRHDTAMTEVVKARVFESLNLPQPRARSKVIKIAILIAAMISLFVTTAFACSRYFMQRQSVESQQVNGYWTEASQGGEIISQQEVVFPDADMIFTFTGPAEKPSLPEFRCFYLPSEPDMGSTDEEGWATYLSDSGEAESIPYLISASAVSVSGRKSILSGDVSIVMEEYWDEWYVLALTSDYTGCSVPWGYDRANYILLFDENKGQLITIGGTSDMKTLLHIARELEIRDSGKAAPDSVYSASIGQIDVGRG